MPILENFVLANILTMSVFFSFSDLCYSKKTRKKVLGGFIAVNKNKPTSERLFGKIDLKID